MSSETKKSFKADSGKKTDWEKIETINRLQDVLYNVRMNKFSPETLNEIRIKLIPYTSTVEL